MEADISIPPLSGIEKLFKKLHPILEIFMPLLITALSFWSIKDFFGSRWDIGRFTMPAIPFLSNTLAEIMQVQPNVLLSAIILFVCALGPLMFYFFVYNLTKRQLPALLTGLFTILPLNPFSTLPPTRIINILSGQDGAHMMSLTFIPVAILIFLFYVKTGQLKWLITVEVFISFLSLISLFSLFVIFVFMILITISETLLGLGKQKLFRFLTVSGVSVVIVGAIYNTFLLSVLSSAEGKSTILVVSNFLPLLFFLVPVLGTIAFLIFDRRPQLQSVFIAVSLSLVFGLLHFVRISFANVALLEQNRYGAEVSLTSAFIWGLIGMSVFDYLRNGQLLAKFPVLYKQRLFTAFIFITLVIGTLMSSILFISRNI